MIAPLSPSAPLTEIELQLLLEAIFRFSGYDFREYAPAFVKRRVAERMRAEGTKTISALQDLILHDSAALDRLVFGFSVTPSELFGDPIFFAELRRTVVPMLRTFPVVRVWDVGCGTGEEAYSLAITLREEGLLRRARVYATDVSTTAIALAKTGRFPEDSYDGAFRRYREAGGVGSLDDYLHVNGEPPSLDRSLRENLVFSTHNLVSDGSFNEFQ
ncbi:MAG: protein-glutamate O-methyltransferase CheR, partial [Candidatus Eremiobacteraeota bacterium]|nr:protein-glutamate O-methyltransferase CheR [Candidatus Eremiobacteraeota bacterium]